MRPPPSTAAAPGPETTPRQFLERLACGARTIYPPPPCPLHPPTHSCCTLRKPRGSFWSACPAALVPSPTWAGARLPLRCARATRGCARWRCRTTRWVRAGCVRGGGGELAHALAPQGRRPSISCPTARPSAPPQRQGTPLPPNLATSWSAATHPSTCPLPRLSHPLCPGDASAAEFGDLLECGHTLRELELGWNRVRGEGGWPGQYASVWSGSRAVRFSTYCARLPRRRCAPRAQRRLPAASRPTRRLNHPHPPPTHTLLQVRPAGAKAIARGLAANASLARLGLAWNGLESEGAARLGLLFVCFVIGLFARMGAAAACPAHCQRKRGTPRGGVRERAPGRGRNTCSPPRRVPLPPPRRRRRAGRGAGLEPGTSASGHDVVPRGAGRLPAHRKRAQGKFGGRGAGGRKVGAGCVAAYAWPT